MKRSPLNRTTPLARRSKKRAAADAEYAVARAAVIRRAGGMCEVRTPACVERSHAGSHCHHARRRSQGGGHTDDNLRWLCSAAHEWVHANPAEAFKLGLLVPSWAE